PFEGARRHFPVRFTHWTELPRVRLNSGFIRLRKPLMRRLAPMAAVLLLAACGQQQPAQQPDSSASAPAPAASAGTATDHDFSAEINAGDFAAHVKVLASDAFGGRQPGTKGARLTTDYLISQFKRMGLKPGNDGKWLQKVPVVSTNLTNTDVTL